MTDIYFPVEKVPVEQITPGYEHPSALQYAIVVDKPDGVKRVVQYCSELYHLVPNAEIIPAFEAELSKFFAVETRVKSSRDARFFIDFILKDKLININKVDQIFPMLQMVNSYDGSIQFHYQAKFWRQVCANGMMGYAGNGKTQLKSMHTPRLGKETSFEGILQMTSEFMAEAGHLSEVYMELQDQGVKDYKMRIEEVVENTAFPLKLYEDVEYRLEEELNMLPGVKSNDWMIYGAFNYQLNHNDDFKAKETRKFQLDQEILHYLLAY